MVRFIEKDGKIQMLKYKNIDKDGKIHRYQDHDGLFNAILTWTNHVFMKKKLGYGNMLNNEIIYLFIYIYIYIYLRYYL